MLLSELDAIMLSVSDGPGHTDTVTYRSSSTVLKVGFVLRSRSNKPHYAI